MCRKKKEKTNLQFPVEIKERMRGHLIELDKLETWQTSELLVELVGRVVVVLEVEMVEGGKDVDELIDANIVDVAKFLL